MATKEEILDYATNTPENTNRNVLNSMLDEYNSGGSSGANIVVCPLTSEYDRGAEAYVYTAQMTAGELYAAESVVFEISQDAEQMEPGMKLPCLKADSLLGQYRFGFVNPNSNNLTIVYITANSPLDYPTNAGDGGVG